jgi:phosphomannomutase
MCMVEDDKIRNEVEHQMWVRSEGSDEILHVYLEAYENELARLLAEHACTEMLIRAVKSGQACRKEGGG